jgi:uncharacterized damage-inducible protein DinB
MTGMTWSAPEVHREDPPNVADERAAVTGWLRFHRETLLTKCAGLDADRLKQASVPPSNLTLLGLVRHMTEVERSWFRRRFAGEQVDPLYYTQAQPDGDFENVADADAEHDYAAYLAECRASDAAAAGHDLDETFVHPRLQAEMDLRWIYLHMIEEYARHNGHADLLRERIDGVVGD